MQDVRHKSGAEKDVPQGIVKREVNGPEIADSACATRGMKNERGAEEDETHEVEGVDGSRVSQVVVQVLERALHGRRVTASAQDYGLRFQQAQQACETPMVQSALNGRAAVQRPCSAGRQSPCR